ncbi:gibberellin 3-beta-dioxygenase 3 [Quillaja saponaria]|uniref:gibberellin 3beta-dioxygenase n=1 Tax=Quillaja saponaria TaxID=32244 RepID=A0AAD7LEC9_QUISA|nr:gibberellin 3-beta-dioxygenase 3 [Quillaja saponaria]
MNSILESFKSNPVHDLNHIIPLDFKTANNLPDSHKWTDHPIVDPFTVGSVPIIDLSDPNAISLIRHACEKWGVFQVTNHGIPLNLLKQVELQTLRLFSLPADQKVSALRSPDGITGYGQPRISVFFPKMMWSEVFSMMGSPMEHATKLWPHQHDHQANFCNIMEEYQKEMKKVSEKMFKLMVESLGVSLEEVEWLKPTMSCKDPQTLLQLNSYPVCPESDTSRAMGFAPHTDSSFLTVLHQSTTTSDLQIFRDNIGWMPVHPISGALVVNVGDLMHILSNGQFNTVLHRVLVNNTHHRVSAAYFYGPPRDVKISPSINLIDHDHPPLFCPVSWKELLDIRAKHYNKALDFFRNDIVTAK